MRLANECADLTHNQNGKSVTHKRQKHQRKRDVQGAVSAEHPSIIATVQTMIPLCTRLALIATCLWLLPCEAGSLPRRGTRVPERGARSALTPDLFLHVLTERRERLMREEEMLAKTVCRLEDKTSKKGGWSGASAPSAHGQSASPCQMRLTIEAPKTSGVQYLWIKKLGEERKVAVVQAVKPGRHPILSADLPEGEYVAMAFSSKNGLWTGSPFKIGSNRIEL